MKVWSIVFIIELPFLLCHLLLQDAHLLIEAGGPASSPILQKISCIEAESSPTHSQLAVRKA